MSSSFPVLDYEKHPAFKPFIHHITYDDQHIDQLVKTLDQILVQSSQQSDVAQLHKQTADYLAQMKALIIANNTDKTFGELIDKAFDAAFSDLCCFCKVDTKVKQNNSYNTLPKDAQQLCDELTGKGIVRIKLPAQAVNKLNQYVSSAKKQLKEAYQAERIEPSACSFSSRSLVYQYVQKLMRESNLSSALKGFKEGRSQLRYVALSHADSRDSWWESPYQAYSVETAKTSYFHLDRDTDVVKAIIYLSDVDVGNGPFSYVPSSMQWHLSAVTRAIAFSFEQVLSSYIGAKEQHVGSYRRIAFISDQGKQLFMMLPRRFRRPSHFGDDVLDDSKLSHTIQDDEKVILSEDTNLFLFQGGYLLHRGGLVKKSDRWVLQLAFGETYADENNVGSPVKRFKKIINSIIGRCSLCLRG